MCCDHVVTGEQGEPGTWSRAQPVALAIIGDHSDLSQATDILHVFEICLIHLRLAHYKRQQGLLLTFSPYHLFELFVL